VVTAEMESVQETMKEKERNLCGFLWFLPFSNGSIEDLMEGFDEEEWSIGLIL